MLTDADLRHHPLVGSWRLQSMGRTWCDTGERDEPLGPNPEGRMVLTETGRVIFLIAGPDRNPPRNEADCAALFNGMTAYTGLVRLDGPDRFITTIDLAWNPLWRGEQLRFFMLQNDRLTIRTPEQTHPGVGDRLLVGDLVWIRE
jgi:hypothetical protein